MNRRRILLSYLANSFSWELYSKVYFYNELVPTTINGKNVLNKAKIVKVSGNGVIENQLAHEFSSTYYDKGNSATLSFLSDNTIGVLATQSYSYGCLKNIDNLFIKDHYVLITLLAKGTTNSYANIVQLYDGENWHTISGNELIPNAFKRFSLLVKLKTTLTTISHFRFCQDGRTSGWDTIYAKDLMIKDLTLMFGTGNEPTTLTDNRIQNILNRGYIPFNLGEYKESDIGVISTTKADTTALDTITFKAQLGGANTFEITNTDYVFTRNYNTYRFSGSESWSLYNGVLFYTTISGGRTGDGQEHPVNLRCSKYACKQTTQSGYTASNGSDLTASWDRTNSQLLVKDTNYSSTSTFATSMTGVVIQYPLATPQVISIPKKHLGIKRIRDLNWDYTSGTYSRFTAVINDIKPVSQVSDIGNIYCSNFITDSVSNIYSHTKDKSIGVHNSTRIWVYDSECTNTADFLNKYGDYLIFYETENEVADIENVIDIESGGTISANWFSWVENQLVQASDLQPSSSFTQSGVTFSRNTTNKTVTISGLCSNSMTIDITSSISITTGHIYWLFSGIEGTASTYHLVEVSGNKKSYQGSIFTLNNNTAKYAIYINNGYNINLTFKPQIVDLTLAFGSGNEPTNVNDPRIQYIINKGYIPTNTTGTYKEVSPVVLPNIELSVKCK